MAEDKIVRQRPDDSASVKDDDFTIESASHREAFTEVPADTTDRAVTEPAPVVKAAVAADEVTDTATPPEAEGEDADHVSASRFTAESTLPAPAAPPKGKNKVPLKERTSQLKHEVDTLTHTKHRTKGEVEAAERRLADVTRQIADHEARLRSGQPAAVAAKPGAPAADADEPPMPEFPDYRKFSTDEEYEAARAKYQTDLVGWQRQHSERLERRIAAGVESRFKDVGAEAQFATAVQRLEATRDKVRATKPDWNEKAVALKDIQSSWYDPAAHGEAKTPFLSDLARTLLMQERDEGGELLYWLGSDLDRAQALADLLPTRPLRDALLSAPSVIQLLDHFATDDGRAEFEAMKQMHPIRANQAIGALAVRLAGASSGSSAASHPITKAQPSARPPAGTPGARGTTGASATTRTSFEDWMAAEDAKERAARERIAGIAR